MHKRTFVLASMSLLCLISPDLSSAQPNPPSTAITFAGIRVAGSLRFRPEVWNWFDATAAQPNYKYFVSLLRLSFSQERPRWDWQAEFAQPLLLNLPDNSIASSPQGQVGLGASYFAANANSTAAYFFAKQGFVRLKSIFGDKASNVRFGRFEFVAFVRYRYPNEIGLGVYDIHSPRIPNEQEMEDLLRKALQFISPDQLWVNPDCGLKTRRWDEARPALTAMVEAARKLRDSHHNRI